MVRSGLITVGMGVPHSSLDVAVKRTVVETIAMGVEVVVMEGEGEVMLVVGEGMEEVEVVEDERSLIHG
jgi:hypothetical protein